MTRRFLRLSVALVWLAAALTFSLATVTPVAAATSPVSGAVSKSSSFSIVPPWASGVTHQITNGYNDQGGSGYHKNTNSTCCSNDYYALDFNFGLDEAVYPIASGTVIFAGTTTGGWSSYGQIVYIDHGNGYKSLYAHLDYLSVSTGQSVGTGTQLGGAGSTGQCGGVSCGWQVHLHFALYLNSNGPQPYGGQAVVPEPFDSCTKGGGSCENLGLGDQLAKGNGGGSCTAPQLGSPSDGATISSDAYNYMWNNVGCQHDGFTFRIRTDTNFDDPNGNHLVDRGVGSTSYTPDQASDLANLASHHDQTLYWAVRTVNPVGPWSTPRSFTIHPGGGGGCGDPGANQVAIYADTSYGGSCVTLGVGDYSDPSSLGSVGNDNAESIKVGSGTTVTLCQDAGFSGTCVTLTGSVDNLDGTSLGRNQLSSVRVMGASCSDPSSDQVTVYADQNYGGTCATLGMGDYPNPASIGIGNDNAESIKIGGNVQAQLCMDDNYGGGCTTLQNNATDLSSAGFSDNQLSSMKVQTRPDSTPPSAGWDAPSNGATIDTQVVSLQAHATDSGGSGLQSIAFSAMWGGSWHGLATQSVSGDSASTSYDWDMCAAGVPDGDVEIGLGATDNANNTFTYSDHWTNYHITKAFDCTPDEPDGRVINDGDTLTGRINPAGDTDTFVFDAVAGQTATIALDAADQTKLDTRVWLYNPDTTLLAWNDDSGAGLNSLISNVVLPATGQYQIVAGAYAGTGDYSITLTLSPLATHLAVSGIPSPTVSGMAHTLTVTARGANGRTAIGYTGTVHFTSSDAHAVLPADTTLTGGVGTFSVTLETAGTQWVRATDTVTATIVGAQDGIVVAAGPANHFGVSTVNPYVAGVTHTITITARDAAGNTATGYLGTIHFTSSDGHAVLPGDYHFGAADNGIHKFTITLKTAGSQWVRATDTVTAAVAGAQKDIVVTPGPANHFGVTAVSPSIAGTSHTLIITARDANGNTATGYLGTIRFTSSDSHAVLPANYHFTAADKGVHRFSIRFETAGTQSVRATDTVTAAVAGVENGIVVTSGAAASFTVSTANPWAAGGSHSVTITARDAYGNVATGYRGTVHLTSSDHSAVLPANYAFVSGDAGVHKLTVKLRTAGSQWIRATDTVTASITGSQTVTVT